MMQKLTIEQRNWLIENMARYSLIVDISGIAGTSNDVRVLSWEDVKTIINDITEDEDANT